MIDIEKSQGLWTLRINRPDKANALTAHMLEEIYEIVQDAQNARALIITGSGKVFSAGADLEAAKAGLATSDVWERVSASIAKLPCLTIAALFICATVKNANAEDKFYAFFVNDVGTIWELILSIKDKKLEASLSSDCGSCQYNNDILRSCEKTEIGLKNTFETWCRGTWTHRKLRGNLKTAVLGFDGEAGSAIFHFIPFSKKNRSKHIGKRLLQSALGSSSKHRNSPVNASVRNTKGVE